MPTHTVPSKKAGSKRGGKASRMVPPRVAKKGEDKKGRRGPMRVQV